MQFWIPKRLQIWQFRVPVLLRGRDGPAAPSGNKLSARYLGRFWDVRPKVPWAQGGVCRRLVSYDLDFGGAPPAVHVTGEGRPAVDSELA